jgi:formylmethanofuran dehydrogenase subunit E
MHTHNHHSNQPVTFEDCIHFHGHACPGLAYGYRAATAAMEALGVARPEDEELVAICETDACGVDAIQVVAGTTAGKGNLVIQDYGKHAFTFFNRKDGKAVRITFNRNEKTEAGDFATIRAKVFSGKATAAEEEKFHELMHTATMDVLDAPSDKIMKIANIVMNSPRSARIFATVTCERCGESVADAKTRKVNGKVLCIPCANGSRPARRK